MIPTLVLGDVMEEGCHDFYPSTGRCYGGRM